VVFWGLAPAADRKLLETGRGTSQEGHAFFCNFLLTKALAQFNMAVDKTRGGKEVGEKPTIINALGENGKEKLVTTFLN
jgi:hypothetical protein